MKIFLKLPEREFHMEREPMSREQAEGIRGLLYALIAAETFIRFAAIIFKV